MRVAMLVGNRVTSSGAVSEAKIMSMSTDNREKQIKKNMDTSTHTHIHTCMQSILCSSGIEFTGIMTVKLGRPGRGRPKKINVFARVNNAITIYKPQWLYASLFLVHIMVQLSVKCVPFHVVILRIHLIPHTDAIRFQKNLVNKI